MFQLIILHN